MSHSFQSSALLTTAYFNALCSCSLRSHRLQNHISMHQAPACWILLFSKLESDTLLIQCSWFIDSAWLIDSDWMIDRFRLNDWSIQIIWLINSDWMIDRFRVPARWALFLSKGHVSIVSKWHCCSQECAPSRPRGKEGPHLRSKIKPIEIQEIKEILEEAPRDLPKRPVGAYPNQWKPRRLPWKQNKAAPRRCFSTCRSSRCFSLSLHRHAW